MKVPTPSVKVKAPKPAPIEKPKPIQAPVTFQTAEAPDKTPSSTVADVLSRTHLGKEVAIPGHIVREVNYETVLFTDGTGWIEVVLEEDDYLPAKTMEIGQPILLHGTPKKGFKGKIYIEFDAVEIL